ncbi:MAG: capsular polysaccharide biosynthesis protein [Firmicutes bacterium]|nr:capsular polysaccharide biosynthesis protein [Bacillota bacterium]
MIDFHSHFLPKMDDGSKSCEMSLEMLKTSYDYGIGTMVATPHFYIKQNSAARFLERRKESFSRLEEAIADSKEKVPDIILGAEVYYFRGISHYDDIEKLKISGTDLLLLEMPFEQWNKRVLDEVEAIHEETGITPVIAHLDRYLDYQKGTDNVDRLLDMGFPIQINSEFVNGFFTRKKAIEMITDGVVDVLGSDCHNMDKRRPDLGKSLQIIEKKCGADTVDNIYKKSRQLLGL